MILRSEILNISSFTNDDRAFIEPHNDIISTALVVIGFVIFTAIVSSTYIAFDENSYALENYRHAALIANDIVGYKEIQGSRIDVISADELDEIATPIRDDKKHIMFFQRYSGNIDFSVDVSTNDAQYHWTIDRYEGNSSQKDIIAASAPVVIELGNNARCVPGTLTVKVRKNKWI
ncbi:hypothetical protein V7O66_07250 [Methanolobus sp. ZRKC3]|uniref:hypothetical protein n=1 Tax=Methanolobus sp. ZRKC3 TaxID=3125786 RepID=UPI003247AF19